MCADTCRAAVLTLRVALGAPMSRWRAQEHHHHGPNHRLLQEQVPPLPEAAPAPAQPGPELPQPPQLPEPPRPEAAQPPSLPEPPRPEALPRPALPEGPPRPEQPEALAGPPQVRWPI